MANISAPYGFRQFRRMDGGAPTAGFDTLTIMSSDTSVIFTGDPVADLTGPATGAAGFADYVTGTTAGGAQVRGIFMGCEYYNNAVNRKVWSPYFPGSVATSCGTNDVTAWVCTDPEMTWTVQVGGTSTGPGVILLSSQTGLNIGFSSATQGSGNVTTGISAVTLNSTSIATTNTLPFRFLDFYSNYAPPGSNGTDNTSVGQIVIVTANNWDRLQLTGV